MHKMIRITLVTISCLLSALTYSMNDKPKFSNEDIEYLKTKKLTDHDIELLQNAGLLQSANLRDPLQAPLIKNFLELLKRNVRTRSAAFALFLKGGPVFTDRIPTEGEVILILDALLNLPLKHYEGIEESLPVTDNNYLVIDPDAPLVPIHDFLKNGSIQISAYRLVHCLADWNYERALEGLLQFTNLQINIRNEYGETALHRAVTNGYVNIVQRLLADNRIDPQAQSAQGNTPLHHAIRNGNLELVQMMNPRVDESKRIEYIQFALQQSRENPTAQAKDITLALAKTGSGEDIVLTASTGIASAAVKPTEPQKRQLSPRDYTSNTGVPTDHQQSAWLEKVKKAAVYVSALMTGYFVKEAVTYQKPSDEDHKKNDKKEL